TRSQRRARLVEAIDHENQVAIDEASRHTMANAVGPQFHRDPPCVRLAPQRCRETETAAEHLLAAACEEGGIAARPGIRLGAALAGSDVGHSSGRPHVAVLAVLAVASGGTVEPFAVGTVDMHAEDDAFVTGSAVAALLVEGRVSILAAIDI